MKRVLLLTLLSAALVLCAGGGNSGIAAGHAAANPADLQGPVPASTAGYALMAWSELGMHCIDGKDYSVFSVLPPYNIIHAQLIQKTEPPTIITTGVTIVYQATADAKKSINSSSAGKSNFWNYVNTLFLANVPPETGLAGYKTQTTKAEQPELQRYRGILGSRGNPDCSIRRCGCAESLSHGDPDGQRLDGQGAGDGEDRAGGER